MTIKPHFVVIGNLHISTSLKNFATAITLDGNRLKIITNGPLEKALFYRMRQDMGQDQENMRLIIRMREKDWSTARGTLKLVSHISGRYTDAFEFELSYAKDSGKARSGASYAA